MEQPAPPVLAVHYTSLKLLVGRAAGKGEATHTNKPAVATNARFPGTPAMKYE